MYVADDTDAGMEKETTEKSKFFPRKVFAYNEDQFTVCTESGASSQFDKELQSSWVNVMNDDHLNYKIDNLKTKVLSPNYGFIVQLNVKRATSRRKPMSFSKIVEPFNKNLFNFQKVTKQEVLFELQPKHWEDYANDSKLKQRMSSLHLVIVNVSPLEYCHSLLVPYLYDDCPQVLTFNCLRLAVETMLLSSDPTLRMGFNSLGAFASVNHLHFHLYYLKERLFVETAEVDHLASECYEIKCFPAEGFAFQLINTDVTKVVSAVMKLVSFFIENSIAHNVFITRGSAFSNSKLGTKTEQSLKSYEAIRIYVWARQFYHGAKDDFSFNPAVCELAGHIPVKSETFYDKVTEDDVSSVIKNACHDIFVKIHKNVKQLYLRT